MERRREGDLSELKYAQGAGEPARCRIRQRRLMRFCDRRGCKNCTVGARQTHARSKPHAITRPAVWRGDFAVALVSLSCRGRIAYSNNMTNTPFCSKSGVFWSVWSIGIRKTPKLRQNGHFEHVTCLANASVNGDIRDIGGPNQRMPRSICLAYSME